MATLSLNDYEDVRIAVPWGHIAGRWYGNRTERPILAIHGWMDNLGTFETLIPLLPDYLGVLCIDLPGHGCSSPLPAGMTYHVLEWVYVISRVVKEYNWPKVSLMGHSLGGFIGFIYAALAPLTVDMLIVFELVHPLEETIDSMTFKMDTLLSDDNLFENKSTVEPRSYSLDQLCDLVSKRTSNSITSEVARHVLHRNVTESEQHPGKFYLSVDRRIRYCNCLGYDLSVATELSRRITNNPYMLITTIDSPFITPKCYEIISIMKKQNPHFEHHQVTGSHHVHLTNAKDCAQYIVPFLRRHRPRALASWSLTGEETVLNQQERRKAQASFPDLNKTQRSKM